MTPVSDIDMIYSRWHNNLAVLGGTMTSLITTIAIAKISEAVISRFVDWDNSRILKSIVLISTFTVGFTVGHIVTTQCIGLIAQSAIGKLGTSLSFSTLGSLSGIALYLQTRVWL